MSDFVLHYDILEGIAKSSNSLGRQADEYANSLTSRIANAITSVTGSSSGYLEDASYYVNEKVGQLQKKAQEFFDFAEQVTILAETATRVDEEVQKFLAENQEEFLSHHESLRIDDWKADILNWLVGIKNKLPFLEVLGNILSAVDTILESFVDSIKYWYHCEGGKYILEFIGGIAIAALAVAIFVFTFPASGFMAICGVIGAGIAAVNAITNVATSFRAAYTACNGDPTWARIYSKQNTLSQVIRETNFNNGTLNGLSYLGADVLDTTEVFCSIVGIGQIGLSIKKLFSKANFNIFKKGSLKLGDFKTNIKNSFAKTKISIKKGVSDLKVNIKNIFGKTKNLDDMADLNQLDDISLSNMDDILPEGGTQADLDGITIINKKYAGQTYELNGNLATKYPDGVKFTNEGFPDFSPYSNKIVKVDGLQGDAYYDFIKANQAVGYKSTPKGYTWHHVEDGTTMMLVPSDLHGTVRHTGGASLIREGIRP